MSDAQAHGDTDADTADDVFWVLPMSDGNIREWDEWQAYYTTLSLIEEAGIDYMSGTPEWWDDED